MKIYGYDQKDQENLLELREITFQISPEEAQQIANFFTMCAKRMVIPNWEHEHFNGGNSPDIIVFYKK